MKTLSDVLFWCRGLKAYIKREQHRRIGLQFVRCFIAEVDCLIEAEEYKRAQEKLDKMDRVFSSLVGGNDQYLTDKEKEQVLELADKEYVSASVIIRRAVRQYLKSLNKDGE